MSPYRFALAVSLVALACGGKIDLNATEDTATRRVGTGNGGASSSSGSSGSSSSSSSSGSLGPCAGGALVPFEEDFEDGVIGDGFTVNSPSAFSIEWDEPIHGNASLRVKPNPASYIARKVKGVCAARLAFTIRASEDFLKAGASIARIDAGSHRFSLVVQPGGTLAVIEEIYAASAAGGSSLTLGSIFSEDPTTIVIDVDFASSKLTAGVKSATSPGPTNVSDLPSFADAAPPAITSIELGTTPGVAWDPKGLYYLDDISID